MPDGFKLRRSGRITLTDEKLIQLVEEGNQFASRSELGEALKEAKDDIRNAIENGDLIIEQAQAKLAQLDIGRYGRDEFHYDHGYEQGRKDAARVILLSFQDHR